MLNIPSGLLSLAIDSLGIRLPLGSLSARASDGTSALKTGRVKETEQIGTDPH